MTNKGIIDMEMYDLECNFEPLKRTRSNTWPMPQPEDLKDAPLINDTIIFDNNKFMKSELLMQENNIVHTDNSTQLPSIKKKSSKRNAWGNLSYAELITMAITSVNDQRLTLSQIYSWMVKNVPFFKGKANSNSSAGWKNSVRHNLSLHNRFIRIPNEGAGKSSWWMLNPNAKSEKSTRRRTVSMETEKYERKRSRARKNVEILVKENLQTTIISSTNSSNRKKVDFSLINTLPTTETIKSFTIPSRISSFVSSGVNLNTIPVISDKNEYFLKCTQTFKQVSDCQTEITHPVLTQEMQKSLLPNNQVDLYSTYQIANNISITNNVKVIPIAYSLTQSNELCILHHQNPCTCSINVVKIANTLPSKKTQSYVLLESEQTNHCFLDKNENQRFNMSTYQSNLRSIQEIKQISTDTLQIDNTVETQMKNTSLIRNNSLLDDIDEIIKREQYTSVNIVNDSMTSSLYISKNVKQNS